MFYVYQLRLDGESFPFYIGKGKGGRTKAHFRTRSLACNTRKDTIIKAARRDGREVIVDVLVDDLDEASAFEIERALIAHFGRRDVKTGCLANMTDGGDGPSGRQHREETKRRIGEAHKGKTISATQREELAAYRRGLRASAETKARMAVAHTGKRHTEETRAKLSALKDGKARAGRSGHKALVGRGRSDETRAKMRANAKRCVLSPEAKASIVSTCRSGVSQRAAGARFGVSQSRVSKLLREQSLGQ